jgi:hypothetical protein
MLINASELLGVAEGSGTLMAVVDQLRTSHERVGAIEAESRRGIAQTNEQKA